MSIRRSTRARVPTQDPDNISNGSPGNNSNGSPKDSPRKRKRSPRTSEELPAATDVRQDNGAIHSGRAVDTSSPSPPPSQPAQKSRKVILPLRGNRSRLRKDQEDESREGGPSQVNGVNGDEASSETVGSTNNLDETHNQKQQEVKAKLEEGEESLSDGLDLAVPEEDYAGKAPMLDHAFEMSEQDRIKFLTIISNLRPVLLSYTLSSDHSSNTSISMSKANGSTRIRTAQGGSSLMLRELLESPPVRLDAVKDFLIRIRDSMLRSSNNQTAKADDQQAMEVGEADFVSACMALVDEMTRSSVEASRNRDQGESSTMAQRRSMERTKYALSMRVQAEDYYTDLADMSAEQAAKLDVGNSRLVSIAPEMVDGRSRRPPTLGERLGGSRKANGRMLGMGTARTASKQVRERRSEGYAKPASHLYYSPWASFAPSYDSFDGNLSYAASCALWRAKKEENDILKKMASDGQGLVDSKAVGEIVASLGEDVDRESIMAAYKMLEEEEEREEAQKAGGNTSLTNHASVTVDQSLEENRRLFVQLETMQAQRLKRYVASEMLLSKEVRDDKLRTQLLEASMQPDLKEQNVARALLDSLSRLVSTKENQSEGTSLAPSVAALRAASASAVIDPALVDGEGQAGHWGTLDDSFFGPEPSSSRRQGASNSSRSALKMPTAIQDDFTVQLGRDFSEGKSQSKGSMASRDRGVGLLDRFAASRGYSREDHAHDREMSMNASSSPSKKAQGQPSASQRLQAQQQPYDQGQQARTRPQPQPLPHNQLSSSIHPYRGPMPHQQSQQQRTTSYVTSGSPAGPLYINRPSPMTLQQPPTNQSWVSPSPQR